VVTIEDLRRRFGKRMERVEQWLREDDRVMNYIVDLDGEISACVRGDTGEYAVLISPEGLASCGCMGQRTHHTICKHILYLLLYSWARGDLSLRDVEKVLGGEKE